MTQIVKQKTLPKVSKQSLLKKHKQPNNLVNISQQQQTPEG